MIKITKLKNGTVLIGDNKIAFDEFISDTVKEQYTTIDKQMIVTKDEVDYQLEKIRSVG